MLPWKQKKSVDSFAGQLRDTVQIQRKGGQSPDEYGHVKTGWANAFTRRAMVQERTGLEQLDAGALHAKGYASVTMRGDRQTKTITPDDRMAFGGEQWSIVSAITLTRDQRYVQFLIQKGAAT